MTMKRSPSSKRLATQCAPPQNLPIVRRRSPPPRNSGYVLLYTLWLLLLAATFTALLLSVARRHDDAVATEYALMRVNGAAESAIYQTLHELLITRPDGSTPARKERILAIDGAQVRVVITEESARLDLNSADDESLMRLVAALPGLKSGKFLRALRTAQRRDSKQIWRLSSFSEIEALDGLTPDSFACLYRYSTLYTEMPLPTLGPDDAWMARTLGFDVPRSASVMEVPEATKPTFYRIEARSELGPMRSAPLYAHIRLTGQHARPFLVYEWRGLPEIASTARCPG